MRFHDYKLQSYSVLDSGAHIVFELVYDYPGVDTARYLAALRGRKMRAWRIDSAVGFSGFVIGRDVEGTP